MRKEIHESMMGNVTIYIVDCYKCLIAYKSFSAFNRCPQCKKVSFSCKEFIKDLFS
jgi:hypothetical protein